MWAVRAGWREGDGVKERRRCGWKLTAADSK